MDPTVSPELDGELIITTPKVNWTRDKDEKETRASLDLCDNA
jgi:hypothetical protein